jgi:hypothetical protein
VTRGAFGVSLVALVLWGNFASAQSPAVGQLPLPGDLYGYSPLVPTIDPFPTRTSGYAPSMFLPKIGGKRIYPPPVVIQERVVVAAPDTAVVLADRAATAGPVEFPAPARAWYRFRR